MVDLADPGTLGYLFIGSGVVLLLVEVASPGFFVAIPATVLIILGFLAFFVPFEVFVQLAPLAVLLVGVPATAVTLWMYRRISPPSKAPLTRSADSLVGTEATVATTVQRGSTKGKVRLGHEVWSATTSRPDAIPEGARVRVTHVEGVILDVEPVEPVEPVAGGAADAAAEGGDGPPASRPPQE